MALTQRDINYVPHSRPKKYVLLLPQLRSGVRETTFSDMYQFPRVSRFSLLQKQLMAIMIIFVCLFLLICELGIADPIFRFFKGE